LASQTRLTLSLFIEVSVSSMCVAKMLAWIYFCFLTFFLLEFGTVPTVWYFVSILLNFFSINCEIYLKIFSFGLHIHIQYTHIVGKYIIYLCKFNTQVEKGVCGDHFWHVLQSVPINFTLTDNVRMFFVSS
jgi:hypothetical protein